MFTTLQRAEPQESCSLKSPGAMVHFSNRYWDKMLQRCALLNPWVSRALSGLEERTEAKGRDAGKDTGDPRDYKPNRLPFFFNFKRQIYFLWSTLHSSLSQYFSLQKIKCWWRSLSREKNGILSRRMRFEETADGRPSSSQPKPSVESGGWTPRQPSVSWVSSSSFQ